jgi:hypothetical protein
MCTHVSKCKNSEIRKLSESALGFPTLPHWSVGLGLTAGYTILCKTWEQVQNFLPPCFFTRLFCFCLCFPDRFYELIGIYEERKEKGRVWWLTQLEILATWETESQGIVVWGQPGQKVCEIQSEPIKAGHLSSRLCQRYKVGRLRSRLAWAKNIRPPAKAKRAWRHGLSGRVPCLPSTRPCVQTPVPLHWQASWTCWLWRELSLAYRPILRDLTLLLMLSFPLY